MGKNNRKRRAAKQRDRARASAGGAPPRSGPRPLAPSDAQIERILLLTAQAVDEDDGSLREQGLAALAAIPRRQVWRVAERVLLQHCRYSYGLGWQPSELARHARRGLAADEARLVLWVLAVEAHSYAKAEIHPSWRAQLDALDLPEVGGQSLWLAEAFDATRIADDRQLLAVLRAVGLLATVPQLEVLIPPPSVPRATKVWGRRPAPPSDPVLEKVRALLAKAESTEFEAEAEAFTAKAHELMARHSIDSAMVGDAAADDQPVAIRIPIDEPYVDAKSWLLHYVALNMRCRSVFAEAAALTTVVGFEADLNSVELLYTSLLVQAQSALVATSRSAPPGARSRSRSFRSSFLRAYARRIGERLAEINAAVLSDATADLGPSLLPVLASRQSHIDAAVDELFPELTTSSRRVTFDPAGAASGRQAADLAQLSFGQFDVAS